MLRSIFGPQRELVAGDWRRLHNEKLHNLYASPYIIRAMKSRKMRWAGHVARVKEMRNAYSILVGRHEGKRPLGKPRSKWKNNISMNLSEIRRENVDWFKLAQVTGQRQALVKTVMKLRVP
jgi:hypothetical protein